MQQKSRKKHATFSQNIARIAKRCPENIRSDVKSVKLLYPKVLKKKNKKRITVVRAVTVVTVVRKIMQPLHK